MVELGFTIDTIKLSINWDKLIDFDYEQLELILKNTQQYIYEGKKRYKGKYKCFSISYTVGGNIMITGSISNFSHGAKYLLPLHQLKSAIKTLGKELGISNIDKARLFRIDLALNIETDKPIKQYSHRLFTDLSNFKKLEQDDGVRFESRAERAKNKTIVFAIYNKGCDLWERKGIKNEQNILRLELRLLKKISEKLGVKKIKIEDLYNNIYIKKLIDQFYYIYSNIKKQTVPKKYEEIGNFTPTLLKSFIQRTKIEMDFGGESGIYKMIEQIDLDRKYKTPNDKARCRKLIKDLSQNTFISKPHPLVEEIDRKVKKECNVYRMEE